MGLDGIELVVEVEKTFDIEITDNEAMNIGTVGDFHNIVWEKIKDKKSTKCTSACLFYKLRRYLTSKYSFSDEDFKLDVNLNDLIPADNKRGKWKEIQHDFDYQLPDLELSHGLQQMMFYLGVTLIGGAFVFAVIAVNFFDGPKWWFLLLVLGIVFMILLNFVITPLRTNIAQKDVREFVKSVLSLNYKELRLTMGANRGEMENIMNCIIHDKIGVDFEEIIPGASLVNDLGID
jgi:hypothetical protein